MRKMTTEIVGPQERIGQQDIVFTKGANGEFGPHVQKKWMSDSVDPIQRVLSSCPERKENSLIWHLTRAVDGEINPEQVDVADTRKMSAKIKEVARFFGADLVGVTRLDPAYIYTHRYESVDRGTTAYGAENRLEHTYAIVVGLEMDIDRIAACNTFIADIEVSEVYLRTAKVVCELAAYIRELGFPARAHHVGLQQVLMVPLAVKAGLGELGRNGYLISKEFGPRLRLGVVTTELPLIEDEPVDYGVQQFCEICKKCAANCPSGSIPKGDKVVVRGVRKWKLDAEHCFRYWNARPLQWDSCSMCIHTCPWNQRNVWYHQIAVAAASRWGLARWALLKLDDLMRGTRPKCRGKWLDYNAEKEADHDR